MKQKFTLTITSLLSIILTAPKGLSLALAGHHASGSHDDERLGSPPCLN
jgi:hypothetical protein